MNITKEGCVVVCIVHTESVCVSVCRGSWQTIQDTRIQDYTGYTGIPGGSQPPYTKLM